MEEFVNGHASFSAIALFTGVSIVDIEKDIYKETKRRFGSAGPKHIKNATTTVSPNGEIIVTVVYNW